MARSMTREDVSRGGVEKFRKAEIDGFFPDGEKGVIYHTRLPASVHLMFWKMEKNGTGISPEQIEAISDKLAVCLRHEDGRPMYENGADMLDNVPMPTIVKLFGTISSMQETDPGNASGEAASMEISTASPTSSVSPQDSNGEVLTNSSTN